MRCNPRILNSIDAEGFKLVRAGIEISDDKDEKWLQKLLFNHPDILPTSEFDDSFEKLIPIGREVHTDSGNIDNLYISVQGKLVLVETKLWKNPEKHRTVVAQIIDYAKEVSRWNYEDLNNAIINASRQNFSDTVNSLDQIIQPLVDTIGLSLNTFQENLIKNLQKGEFLLLIIGDKISPNLALLTESIKGTPGLDFKFGLIEIQLYKYSESDDWPLLVIPDIVGRTVEKTRGVIKVQYLNEKPKIDIEIEDDETGSLKNKMDADIFLENLPIDLKSVYTKWLEIWHQNNLIITWGYDGFSLRSPSHFGNKQKYIFAELNRGVTLIKKADSENLQVSNEHYKKYSDTISKVSSASDILRLNKTYVSHSKLTAEDLDKIFEATTTFAIDIENQTF